MKRKCKKIHPLKKVARAHTVISIILFGVYLLASIIYSPEFLLSDMRSKFSAIADETITIVGKVLDSPVIPAVTGQAFCSNDSLSIDLDWADDENSETFDVLRNNLPLITNLSSSQYQDIAVSDNTTYAYTIIAYGPMSPGSATSGPISITTPNNCETTTTPSVSITAFDSKNISDYTGTPKTTERRPYFSGTTTIPNATISILIPNSSTISSETTANTNGYWSWQPPLKFDRKTYTIFITATDPLNPSTTASTSLSFTISEKDTDEKQKTSTKTNHSELSAPSKTPPSSQPTIPVIKPPLEKPMAFSLLVEPTSVFQGKEMLSTIYITELSSQYAGISAKIQYKIIDSQGLEIMTFSEMRTLHNQEKIYRSIFFPEYISDDVYRLQVEIITDEFNASRSSNFTILPVPIIKLGGGFLITYPQVLSVIGTTSIILLLLLILWLLIFSREYWLYLHALRHITENNLRRAGLLGAKRRGVSH